MNAVSVLCALNTPKICDIDFRWRLLILLNGLTTGTNSVDLLTKK